MYQVKPPPKGTVNRGLPEFANKQCGKKLDVTEFSKELN